MYPHFMRIHSNQLLRNPLTRANSTNPPSCTSPNLSMAVRFCLLMVFRCGSVARQSVVQIVLGQTTGLLRFPGSTGLLMACWGQGAARRGHRESGQKPGRGIDARWRWKNRPFQLAQGTALVEQTIHTDVEQGLQQGRVAQHGYHNHWQGRESPLEITHQCQPIGKAPIRHRVVADHQVTGRVVQMMNQLIGIFSPGDN